MSDLLNLNQLYGNDYQAQSGDDYQDLAPGHYSGVVQGFNVQTSKDGMKHLGMLKIKVETTLHNVLYTLGQYNAQSGQWEANTWGLNSLKNLAKKVDAQYAELDLDTIINVLDGLTDAPVFFEIKQEAYTDKQGQQKTATKTIINEFGQVQQTQAVAAPPQPPQQPVLPAPGPVPQVQQNQPPQPPQAPWAPQQAS